MSNISEDVATKFSALRFKRAYRYLICMIEKHDDGTDQIVVEKAGERGASFEDFRSDMPTDCPRWAVYELEYKTEQDDRYESKLVFLNYNPDNAKDKNARFVYAQ
jgi:hypothetical protein